MSDHGTTARYYAGCRCDSCREAKRLRVAANRARALRRGDLTHGTRNAYSSGCRCNRCKAARQVDYIQLPGRVPAEDRQAQDATGRPDRRCGHE